MAGEPEEELLLTGDGEEQEAIDQPDDEQEGDEPSGDGEEAAIPTFEDEEEAAEEVVDLATFRKVRKELREKARRLRELEASAAPAKRELGPKPKFEDFDYDEQAHEAALDRWYEEKAQIEREEAERRAAQSEQEREGNAILSSYQQRAKALPVSDYDEAVESVIEALGDQRTSLIIAGIEEPEKLIYALYKSPSKMKALSAVTNPVRFAVAIADARRELKMAPRKKAPAPDTAVRSDASATGDKTLSRLEAEASKTGDRSKLIAYRASLRK